MLLDVAQEQLSRSRGGGIGVGDNVGQLRKAINDYHKVRITQKCFQQLNDEINRDIFLTPIRDRQRAQQTLVYLAGGLRTLVNVVGSYVLSYYFVYIRLIVRTGNKVQGLYTARIAANRGIVDILKQLKLKLFEVGDNEAPSIVEAILVLVVSSQFVFGQGNMLRSSFPRSQQFEGFLEEYVLFVFSVD